MDADAHAPSRLQFSASPIHSLLNPPRSNPIRADIRMGEAVGGEKVKVWMMHILG